MTFLRRTFSHLPFFLFLFYMWRVDDMQTDLNMPSSRMMMTPRCLAVSRGKTNIWHDIQPLRITSSGRPTAGWQAESCRWTHGPGRGEPLLRQKMIFSGRYVFILWSFALCWFLEVWFQTVLLMERVRTESCFLPWKRSRIFIFKFI